MYDEPEKQTFGDVLRFYRGKTIDRYSGKSLSQEKLAFHISNKTGLAISRNKVNNWETGKSHLDAQQDRFLLVAIVSIFYKYQGIQTLDEANQLLESGGFRQLRSDEILEITPKWETHGPIREVDPESKRTPQVSYPAQEADRPSLISIEFKEPLPVILHTHKQDLKALPGTRFNVGNFLMNALVKAFFVILERIPDWLLGRSLNTSGKIASRR